MNQVIKQLKQEEAAQLEKDQIRYAALLEKTDPLPDEVKELRQIMERLGKSTEHLQLDHRLMQDVLAAESRIRQGSGLDRVRLDAAKAVRDHFEETERIIKEREIEKNKLAIQSHELEAKWGGAQESVHSLRKLKQLHPDLLRHRPDLQLM